MDFTTPHRIPLSWLLEHGSDSVRLRTQRDLAPPGYPGLAGLETAILQSAPVASIVKSQNTETGAWGDNLLGISPSARDGIREPGTVAQYRRLVQLGYPRSGRAFKLADRLLFRLLSRDDSPELLYEYQKLAKDSDLAEKLREKIREGATAALAEAGYHEDPRIRGAAHKIVSTVSAFLRSPLSEKPFARSGGVTILHPEANPPTWYLLALIAAMPALQRERAGFAERLGQYLSHPATKKTFVIQIGKKSVKPTDLLLGDPTETDAKGNVKDIPFALHFYEQLARIGAVNASPLAGKVLGRLYGECDDFGVWRPKKLPASALKSPHAASYHAYPLQEEGRSPESRLVDVTFRLALIARVSGRPVEYT